MTIRTLIREPTAPPRPLFSPPVSVAAHSALLAFAADASGTIGRLLNIYNPTGTLSGVTTGAIIVWLVAWLALNRLWRTRTIALGKVNVAAFALLAVGFLLTFPPFMDLLQGK